MISSSQPPASRPPSPKILEIGDFPYLQRAFPQTTDFFATGPSLTQAGAAPGQHIVSPLNYLSLARRLADPSYDLVVVQSAAFSPWHWRGLSRLLFHRSVLRGSFPWFRALGLQLLRGRIAAPLAVVDFDDPSVIDSANLFLWDRATVFFKRELPQDRWQVFNGTAHWRLPTPRFRTQTRFRERLAKLRPLPLGIKHSVMQENFPAQRLAAEKTADVFFAGMVQGTSSLRARGWAELQALRAEGVQIDAPEKPLPLAEYLDRCARAWLVWSPPGFGWQCFRTPEAALYGAVPLLARSPLEQHRPLLEGMHAFYYDTEPGELSRVIRAALMDRARLLTMAAAARSHVLQWHTPAAIARYIVETTLELAGKTGSR